MTTEQTETPTNPDNDAHQASTRKTILASEVGLSLTISDQALKDFDRIQEETVTAAEKNKNFSWH